MANIDEVVMISVGKLIDFKNHPFNVIDDEEMDEMMQSIEKRGIIYPIIVRPAEDGDYEIISGHRRKRACLLMNIHKVPCIIRNYSDDEAVITMIETNLNQRKRILPSEKARAYKMQLDALKHQGERIDLTFTQNGSKLRSNDEFSKKIGESREQIRRYIRLNELIPELLEAADNFIIKNRNYIRIALAPAAELSFLTKEEQKKVFDCIQKEFKTPSYPQAIMMKKLSQDKKLTDKKIDELLQQDKPNQIQRYEINYDKFSKILPRNIVTKKEVENFLYKCVQDYINSHK